MTHNEKQLLAVRAELAKLRKIRSTLDAATFELEKTAQRLQDILDAEDELNRKIDRAESLLRSRRCQECGATWTSNGVRVHNVACTQGGIEQSRQVADLTMDELAQFMAGRSI